MLLACLLSLASKAACIWQLQQGTNTCADDGASARKRSITSSASNDDGLNAVACVKSSMYLATAARYSYLRWWWRECLEKKHHQQWQERSWLECCRLPQKHCSKVQLLALMMTQVLKKEAPPAAPAMMMAWMLSLASKSACIWHLRASKFELFFVALNALLLLLLLSLIFYSWLIIVNDLPRGDIKYVQFVFDA